MSVDSKTTFKIVRLIVLGVVTIILIMAGCQKITEPSDVVKLKELEIEKMNDSLRMHGELRELELEGELKGELIESGKSNSTDLCFDC